ncbi:MAG: T9SS type A sorting domain-containing protein [Bacteroidales bacterium]|nr:T9SS type A sorting domain-containing protein [Bacteroidales bacterium]
MKTIIIILIALLTILPRLACAQNISFIYDESGNRAAKITAKMLKESDTAFTNPVFPPYESTVLIESTFDIKVHPVPTKGYLLISLSGDLPTGFNYLFFDQLGKPLLEGRGSGSSHHLDISGLQAGVYYLQVRTDCKAIFRYKILKQ